VEIALAAVALLVSLVALARARRRPPERAWTPERVPSAADEPTRPAPPLGDGERTPPVSAEGEPPQGLEAVAALAARLAERVDELEARCLALESRPGGAPAPAAAPAQAPEDAPPAERVRRALEARGFERVRVTSLGDGPAEVEAARGGTVWKGHVDAGRPERAADALRPARRAFP
jgi:hypothetical protein